MHNRWKWVFGIAVAIIIVLIPLFVQTLIPNGAYGMMNYSNNWHMPIMYGDTGMVGFSMMYTAWLILLGLLILIMLGIAWLVKTLTATK